jgi:uncharacterized protein (UPF0332 family)
MKEDEAKTIVIKNWINKSVNRLNAAKSEFDARRLDIAVSNLYYAMFYIITAALTKKEIYLGKHSAVKAAFHRDFVNTKIVDKQYGKLYQKLFDDRHTADYSPIITFEKDEVKERIQQVSVFIEDLKKTMEIP